MSVLTRTAATICFTVSAAACMAGSANAAALPGSDGRPFDEAQLVSDQELSQMRGGFVDPTGQLFDFSFLSRVQVGLDVQQDVTISGRDLAQAAVSAAAAQLFTQPQIIQNVDPYTLISIQQALDVNVNTSALNKQSQLNQLAYHQAAGLR